MAYRFIPQRVHHAILARAAGVLIVAVLTITASGGCASESNASRGAKEGATTGAVAGAVGGMVTALVFGGNVGDAAARGAVYGGSTGAVVGGMSGSKRDKAEAAAEVDANDKRLADLRKKIGDDAFDGVVALAKCKHEVAIANANVAMQSSKRDYRLAGLWVEVLTSADQRREAEARARFPEIIKLDKKVKTDADAEAAMRRSMEELGDIREAYALPRVCPA